MRFASVEDETERTVGRPVRQRDFYRDNYSFFHFERRVTLYKTEVKVTKGEVSSRNARARFEPEACSTSRVPRLVAYFYLSAELRAACQRGSVAAHRTESSDRLFPFTRHGNCRSHLGQRAVFLHFKRSYRGSTQSSALGLDVQILSQFSSTRPPRHSLDSGRKREREVCAKMLRATFEPLWSEMPAKEVCVHAFGGGSGSGSKWTDT